MDGTFSIAKTDETGWKFCFNGSTQKEADTDSVSVPYYKEVYQNGIADVDLYTTDKYDFNLAVQEHEAGYSVGFQLYNHQVGAAGYVQYWHYEHNEKDRAKKTFGEVKVAIDELVENMDYTRPPMALVTPMMRHALHPIDVPKKQRSGYHIYNWFEELPKVKDWRKSLYGDRYPKKSDVQTMDDFWGDQDEASREVSVQNKGSRNEVMSYKYASVDRSAGIVDWLGRNPQISIPALGLAALFAWLPPEHKEEIVQQIEQGIPLESLLIQDSPLPSEIIQQVQQADEPQFEEPQTGIDTRNLEDLESAFRSKIENVLRKLQTKGWKPRVAEGLRNAEQQQQKIDEGTSSLKNPQNSKHVVGFAADIIDSRYGWNGPAADLDYKFWSDLGIVAKEEGLIWGGTWTTFKDVAHVEMGTPKGGEVNSKNYRSAQELPKNMQKAEGWKIVQNTPRDVADLQDFFTIRVVPALRAAGIPTDFYGEYFNFLLKENVDIMGSWSWNHKY